MAGRAGHGVSGDGVSSDGVSSDGASGDGVRAREPRPQRVNRRDLSTALLTEVMDRPLDPGYAAAAARRAASGETRPRRVRPVTVVVTALIGVLLAVAGVRAAVQAPAADRGRTELLERVEAGTERADDLAAQAARLRADNAELGAALGGAPVASADAAAAALAVDAAAVPVTGPGLQVVLADAAADDATGSGGPVSSGRVVDRDVQLVVNGLWLAGAEAVAVNGQRLSALSSIRAAGEAVLVDYRPLTPPYTIAAIGDPTTMQTGLAASVAGRYLQVLRDNYGIGVSIDTADEIDLPAASRLDLRSASAG